METQEKIQRYKHLKFLTIRADIIFNLTFWEMILFWFLGWHTLFWVMLPLNVLGTFGSARKLTKLEKELSV